MSTKQEHLNRIEATGIIAVVRAESPEQALRVTEAVKAGGVDVIEITMTVPGAVDVIRELAGTYQNEEVLIGAGTVLDSETARLCLVAGAQFVVSPGTEIKTIQLCHRYGKIVIPGIATPTELMRAMERGAEVCKVFPAALYGPRIISALKGPFPHAKLMPTGGVTIDNVGEWFKAGCFAVGVGGELTAGSAGADKKAVTRMAREFVTCVRTTKAEM